MKRAGPIILKKNLAKVFEGKKNMEQIAKCKLLTAVFEADNLNWMVHVSLSLIQLEKNNFI